MVSALYALNCLAKEVLLSENVSKNQAWILGGTFIQNSPGGIFILTCLCRGHVLVGTELKQ